MDIVFTGRHTDVLDRFRKHAEGKLAKLEKLDHKAIRIDVEVMTERNPRQSGRKERVQLTITTRGPAIRAEAAAEDRFSALDLALAKLESRLRRACDRRKARHVAGPPAETARPAEPAPAAGTRPEPARPGEGRPAAAVGLRDAGSDGLAGAVPGSRVAPETMTGAAVAETTAGTAVAGEAAAGEAVAETTVSVEAQGDGPLVVREKTHVAGPMSLDQALFEMELVGHDFFLFADANAGLPSVVYRRRGYQYGVIRLAASPAAAGDGQPRGASTGLRRVRAAAAANLSAG